MWMWAGQHFFQFQLPCTIITKPIFPQKAPCVVLWGLTKCRIVSFLLLNSFKFQCFRNKGECFYSAIALTAKTKQWNLEFTRLQHGIASDWYISCIFLIILAWNQRAVRSQEFLLSPSLQFLLHPYDQVPGWIFSENQQITRRTRIIITKVTCGYSVRSVVLFLLTSSICILCLCIQMHQQYCVIAQQFSFPRRTCTDTPGKRAISTSTCRTSNKKMQKTYRKFALESMYKKSCYDLHYDL